MRRIIAPAAAALGLGLAPLSMPGVLHATATDKTPPKVNFGLTEIVRIAAVDLDTVDGVFCSDKDRALVLDAIRKRLDAGPPFPSPTAPAYRMKVLLTKFDRGAAAARLALIGLGSVHVEGKVQLFDPNGQSLGEVQVNKGLVLGGIAGAASTSDSVIGRFASAVVATVRPPAAKPSSR